MRHPRTLYYSETTSVPMRQVHLNSRALEDAGLDPRQAMIHAAHGWLNENVSSTRHTEDVCDRINDSIDSVGVAPGGSMHLAVLDGLGDTWHFYIESR